MDFFGPPSDSGGSGDSDSRAVPIVNTQDDVNSLICNLMRSSTTNLPDNAEFTNTGKNSNTAWGVSTSGILIYNGLSAELVDPFYPSVYGDCLLGNCYERLDNCLAHPQNTGEFHYHMQSTCQGDSQWDDNKMSANGGGIGMHDSGDVIESAKDAWDVKPYRSAMGIAKDGRPIYGPYYGNMKSYEDCEVDICNGRMINGHYSYVSTWFHPYVMGCYGPGNNPPYSQQCSANPRKCGVGESALALKSTLPVIMAIYFAFVSV